MILCGDSRHRATRRALPAPPAPLRHRARPSAPRAPAPPSTRRRRPAHPRGHVSCGMAGALGDSGGDGSGGSAPLVASYICSFPGCDAAFNKAWRLSAHLCRHTGEVSRAGWEGRRGLCERGVGSALGPRAAPGRPLHLLGGAPTPGGCAVRPGRARPGHPANGRMASLRRRVCPCDCSSLSEAVCLRL